MVVRASTDLDRSTVAVRRGGQEPSVKLVKTGLLCGKGYLACEQQMK
jgi:hypothetical protein